MLMVTTKLRRYVYLDRATKLLTLVLFSPVLVIALIGKGAEYVLDFASEQTGSFMYWVADVLDWDSEALNQRTNNPEKFKKY